MRDERLDILEKSVGQSGEFSRERNFRPFGAWIQPVIFHEERDDSLFSARDGFFVFDQPLFEFVDLDLSDKASEFFRRDVPRHYRLPYAACLFFVQKKLQNPVSFARFSLSDAVFVIQSRIFVAYRDRIAHSRKPTLKLPD